MGLAAQMWHCFFHVWNSCYLVDSHNKRGYPPKYSLHALIKISPLMGHSVVNLQLLQLIAAFLAHEENCYSTFQHTVNSVV